MTARCGRCSKPVGQVDKTSLSVSDNSRTYGSAVFCSPNTVNDRWIEKRADTRVGELVPENQLRGRFRLDGEQGAIDVFFAITPENPALIQQLDLTEISLSASGDRP